MGRDVFDHVIHLCVKCVRSKHEAVFFADFLDALKSHTSIVEIARRQMLRKFGNQTRPLCLNVAFSHEGHAFQQLSLDLTLFTPNSKTNQILLQDLQTLDVDVIFGVVFITFNRFSLLSLLFFVVSVAVLSIGLFDVVFY